MAKQKKEELTVKQMASMGGKARAESLTVARRKEIASKAAQAFWKKRRAEQRSNANDNAA